MTTKYRPPTSNPAHPDHKPQGFLPRGTKPKARTIAELQTEIDRCLGIYDAWGAKRLT